MPFSTYPIHKAGRLMMAILFVSIELFIECQGMILPYFHPAHFSFHLLKRIIAQATHPRALSHQAKRRYRKLVLMRRSWTPKIYRIQKTSTPQMSCFPKSFLMNPLYLSLKQNPKPTIHPKKAFQNTPIGKTADSFIPSHRAKR